MIYNIICVACILGHADPQNLFDPGVWKILYSIIFD